MSIEISRAYSLMEKALDYRSMRQDMIASNIANADTPFYKPRDIRFEDALIQKKKEIFADRSGTLAMAKTDGAHLDAQPEVDNSKATLFYRDGHMARNDGNSVDIDVETTEMSKNSTMYNALIASIRKDANIFKSVIDASGKLS
ncbi:flagellar basal body rod protein FlgB [Sulfurimonas sp. HSL-1716]|uniref:flagellar basal body rod protein FlgB n=1 Tax=Hydrocurvibacter sulfurireducens TaxID=3131937 RepID=UPI0031F9ACE7